MRKILLILFASLPLLLFAQVDSTAIYFRNVADHDLRIICDLADIQIKKIVSRDTLLKNKVFNFVIKEFKKGKIVSEDNLNISSKEQRIPFVLNGDSMVYVVNMVDHAGFNGKRDSLIITVSGILKNDVFKLDFNYPGTHLQKELKGSKEYKLKEVNTSDNHKLSIPVDKQFPVLAYTPPFNTGSSLGFYCLTDDKNVENWYQKHKIKHYYIIYLEVK